METLRVLSGLKRSVSVIVRAEDGDSVRVRTSMLSVGDEVVVSVLVLSSVCSGIVVVCDD